MTLYETWLNIMVPPNAYIFIALTTCASSKRRRVKGNIVVITLSLNVFSKTDFKRQFPFLNCQIKFIDRLFLQYKHRFTR